MDTRLINPFINAVYNTMETMLGIKPEQGAPYLKDNSLGKGDITGIIGIADRGVFGSVALSFPGETAMRIYSIIIGEKVKGITKDVEDAVGELANIVVGGAKQELAQSGMSYHISIPTIIIGKNHTIRHQSDTPTIVVPFKLEESPFLLEVAIKFGGDKKPDK